MQFSWSVSVCIPFWISPHPDCFKLFIYGGGSRTCVKTVTMFLKGKDIQKGWLREVLFPLTPANLLSFLLLLIVLLFLDLSSLIWPLPMFRHLVCFQYFASANNAAMNNIWVGSCLLSEVWSLSQKVGASIVLSGVARFPCKRVVSFAFLPAMCESASFCKPRQQKVSSYFLFLSVW